MTARFASTALASCLLCGTACAQDRKLTTEPTVPAPATASRPSTQDVQMDAAGLDLDTISELERVLQTAVSNEVLSGIVVMIERNGVTGYQETFGLGDIAAGQPMRSDTIVRIYSMTKPIVAAAAMSLWEDGAFTLDEPISKHLPEWRRPMVQIDGELVPAETAITPRHLMTHTSGLGKGGERVRPHRTSLDSFSRQLAGRPLASEPGTTYRYGHSIDVLGRYLEAIEGKSLDVILRERILDPLGMTDTEFWIEDEDDLERTAQLYTRTGRGTLRTVIPKRTLTRKPKAMLGGQGLVSTTDDYARFCRMLVNDGTVEDTTVLEPETVALMRQNHLADIGGTYGLGGWADGSGLYYWGGYAGTKFWVSTTDKAFAIYMVQRSRYEPPTGRSFSRLSRRAVRDSERQPASATSDASGLD